MLKVIYADLPADTFVVVVDPGTVVLNAEWRDIVEPYSKRWTPASIAHSLGLELDDLAYPAPSEPQPHVSAGQSSR